MLRSLRNVSCVRTTMVDKVIMWGIAIPIEVLVVVGIYTIDQITGVTSAQLAGRSKAKDRTGIAFVVVGAAAAGSHCRWRMRVGRCLGR